MVTMPTVRMPMPLAMAATTGAAPLPVPPPMPACTVGAQADARPLTQCSAMHAAMRDRRCAGRRPLCPVSVRAQRLRSRLT